MSIVSTIYNRGDQTRLTLVQVVCLEECEGLSDQFLCPAAHKAPAHCWEVQEIHPHLTDHPGLLSFHIRAALVLIGWFFCQTFPEKRSKLSQVYIVRSWDVDNSIRSKQCRATIKNHNA